MSEEKLVLVREAGTEDYDITYLSDTMPGPNGTIVPLTVEHLHHLVKEALGKNESEVVTKISANNIIIRNVNGIRFLLKNAEPKLEVTFQSTVIHVPGQPAPGQGEAAPVGGIGVGVAPAAGAVPFPGYGPFGGSLVAAGGTNKWMTMIDNNPVCFGHSATVVNGQMIVFGGFCNEATENHTLILSDFTAAGKFHKLNVSGDAPYRRERHTATLVGKRLYIFGGYEREGARYFNDMWVLDTETLMFHSIESRGNIPEGRCGHSACLIDGKIFVFGGRVKVSLGSGVFAGTGVQYRNDLYCFDIATAEWVRYEPRGIGPSGRALHTATAVGKKIYIFGGANSSGLGDDTSGFCDLYELDIETMTWSECETNGTPPTPCYGHTACLYPNSSGIFFFGGQGYQVLNNVNVLDLKSKEWKKQAYAGNILEARWGHTSVLIGNDIIIYGGRDETKYHGTVKTIDWEKELIEVDQEEIDRQISRQQYTEEKKTREAIGNLQYNLEELRHVVTRIGEELVNQKKAKDLLIARLSQAQKENVELLHTLRGLALEQLQQQQQVQQV